MACLVWLLVPVVGVITAVVYGEHGSILFVAIGLWIGVAGAAGNVSLLFVAQFRAFASPIRILAVWAATLTLLLCFACISSFSSGKPFVSEFMEALRMLAVYAAAPALLAAVAAVMLVENAA